MDMPIDTGRDDKMVLGQVPNVLLVLPTQNIGTLVEDVTDNHVGDDVIVSKVTKVD